MKHLNNHPINEGINNAERDMLIKLWNAYIAFVDGIDGIISEYGELSDAYWKSNVEQDMNDIFDTTETVDDIKKNLEKIKKSSKELIDGTEGITGSGRITADRYFKTGALNLLKELTR